MQWFWFLFFDFLGWMRWPVIIKSGVTITNFRFDFNKMRPGTGRYAFAKFVQQEVEKLIIVAEVEI